MSTGTNPFANVEGEYERRMRELREGKVAQSSEPGEQPATRAELRERAERESAAKVAQQQRQTSEQPEPVQPPKPPVEQPVATPEPVKAAVPPRPRVEPRPVVTPEESASTAQQPTTSESAPEAEQPSYREPVASGALARARARGEFRIKPATSSVIKPVPTSLIEVLRERLAGSPAAGYSQDRLVVGYLAATLGLPADELDEKTQEIVAAFKVADPMLTMMTTFESALSKQSMVLERMNEASQGTKLTTDVLELGVAYLLAERTATLDTVGLGPDRIDMTQRKVIVARDRARDQFRRQFSQERVTKGRPLS